MKEDLKLFPYKIQQMHLLSDRAIKARAYFCDWFLQDVSQDENFLARLWMSDAATFTLSGYVNSHNVRIWG